MKSALSLNPALDIMMPGVAKNVPGFCSGVTSAKVECAY